MSDNIIFLEDHIKNEKPSKSPRKKYKASKKRFKDMYEDMHELNRVQADLIQWDKKANEENYLQHEENSGTTYGLPRPGHLAENYQKKVNEIQKRKLLSKRKYKKLNKKIMQPGTLNALEKANKEVAKRDKLYRKFEKDFPRGERDYLDWIEFQNKRLKIKKNKTKPIEFLGPLYTKKSPKKSPRKKIKPLRL